MEPQIRYARTSDGVSIAYYRVGQGKALVVLPGPPASHIALQWKIDPAARALVEAIASRGRSVVQFDTRGCGSSGRNAATYSLDAFVSDLESVVDSLQLDAFDMYALPAMAPIAITYAVRYPDRLDHLVLYAPVARYRDLGASSAFQAIWALRGQDWETYAQSYALIVGGLQWSSDRELAGELVREATTPEIAKRIWTAFDDTFDVTAILPAVRTETLVIEPFGDARNVFPTETAREVARAIPGTRIVAPATQADSLAAQGRFLGILEDNEALPDSLQGQTGSDFVPTISSTIILFTDIADSTAHTERIGDAAFRAAARALDVALRQGVRDAGGTLIDAKTLGDGILATFASAAQAIDAAVRCAEAGNSGGLPLHLGIHAGDVIHEENNVFGGAVNIAARISALSAPGEVLVSRTIADLARTSAGVAFEDRGEHMLKGVADPVRVYAVRAADRA